MPRTTGRWDTRSRRLRIDSAARFASRAARLLNLLTHPGVTDDEEEVRAMEAFLSGRRVNMMQTRTLNIDPEWYFAAVGPPGSDPLGCAARSAQIARGRRARRQLHAHALAVKLWHIAALLVAGIAVRASRFPAA